MMEKKAYAVSVDGKEIATVNDPIYSTHPPEFDILASSEVRHSLIIKPREKGFAEMIIKLYEGYTIIMELDESDADNIVNAINEIKQLNNK